MNCKIGEGPAMAGCGGLFSYLLTDQVQLVVASDLKSNWEWGWATRLY